VTATAFGDFALCLFFFFAEHNSGDVDRIQGKIKETREGERVGCVYVRVHKTNEPEVWDAASTHKTAATTREGNEEEKKKQTKPTHQHLTRSEEMRARQLLLVVRHLITVIQWALAHNTDKQKRRQSLCKARTPGKRVRNRNRKRVVGGGG
jgi:hypothetical protein